MPRVGEIEAVGRDDTLVETRRAHGIQREVRPAPRIHYLRLNHNSQNFVIQVGPIGQLIRRQIRWSWIGRIANAASAKHLVGGRRIDSHTIVVPTVKIEIALIVTAQLEQMVPAQQADAIRKVVIVAIPEALPDILRIHVVRNKRIA